LAHSGTPTNATSASTAGTIHWRGFSLRGAETGAVLVNSMSM